jgi:serine/threonine protein kinase/Tol biopolymer transport system component
MKFTTGARLGPYEIVSRLGAGGMGEVFKAHDTRLGRTVAIKVLPAEFTEDHSARLRFEREARAISQLNHPNICTIHDVGAENGTVYLVMELLDGETLADRLQRGPLPVGDVLRYGAHIADALDAAHRAAIVHRDLKPANIMLTKSGAKLLDFGLAKPVSPIGADQATVQKPITTQGMVVGTIPYMAPEQLAGEDAGAQTDIFALGTVLYEMATGKRPFQGKTSALLMASIASGEPPLVRSLQPAVSPSLEHLIVTCLAKSPDDRWQSAADIARELRWIRTEEPATAAGSRQSRAALIPWAIVGLLALAVVLLLLRLPADPSTPHPTRFTIDPPPGTVFHFAGRDAGPPVLSPDGSRIAFVAMSADGVRRLYVRAFDAFASTVIGGTEGASYPFWSPDGLNVGFFADGRLKRIPQSGGAVITLCNATVGRGAAWSSTGTIVFAPDPYDSLFRVPDSGGTPLRLTTLDPKKKELSHRWPTFLPDGRHFIYLATHLLDREANQAWVGSLDGGERTPLIQSRTQVTYAGGFLLTMREQNLVALAFDADHLRFVGDPFPIADSVGSYPNTASGIFTASAAGTIAFQQAVDAPVSRLEWLDRGGKPIATVGDPGNLEDPALSPDQRYVSTASIDPQSGSQNIWIHDLTSATSQRFTYLPTYDHYPVWSPDSRQIAFDSSRSGHLAIYVKTVGGDERLLYQSKEAAQPTSWSPEGSQLVFQTLSPDTKWELWILNTKNGEARPLLHGVANEKAGQVSPDGRWILYTSDESGRSEVYATRFPDATGRWQVSTDGGSQPRWRADGREVFYLSPDRRIFAALVEAKDGNFVVGRPQALFQTAARMSGERSFDVSSDGKRFLINMTVLNQPSAPIMVVLHDPALGRKAH